MTFIPKFRLTHRLIDWMNENHFTHNRLPKRIEEVFFKSKESPSTIASNLVCYAEKVSADDLDDELEGVIKKDNNALVNYINHLGNIRKPIKPELILCLKGDGKSLSSISCSVGRLPRELEADITNPQHFVNYVRGIGRKEHVYGNSSKLRIPEMEQVVFLSETNPIHLVVENLVEYASVVGRLPEELENLLKGHGSQILLYFSRMNSISQPFNEQLVDSLAGDSESLLQYAQNYLRKRLPVHLEKTMSDPKSLLNYAKNIVKGRLPEELENHFAKDYRLASDYAFNVIRAFACVRLPEVVHAAMVMKSFEIPDDLYIKRYVTECEKDTTVSGSW